MNKIFVLLTIATFSLVSCQNLVPAKKEEFSMILKSKTNDKINLVIQEKDIISVDWEHQSYLFSDRMKKTINDSLKTIAFSSSYLDFIIDDKKIYTVGIGCVCSPITEHLGSSFAYIYLGCKDYFEPYFFEKNGYIQINIINYSGRKDYLFDERIYQLLSKKGLVNAQN